MVGGEGRGWRAKRDGLIRRNEEREGSRPTLSVQSTKVRQ